MREALCADPLLLTAARLRPTTACSGPVSLTCPNNKGLSNIQHAVCDTASGSWTCVEKREAPFGGPVSPPGTWVFPAVTPAP